MKNFKKLVVVLLVFVLALAVFVACDDEEHSHSYTKWGYNAESHWKCCPDDGSIDTTTIGAHVYANGDDTCSVCGYNPNNADNNDGNWFDYNLSEVLGAYADADNWNFQVVYDIHYESMTTPDYTTVYCYKDAFTSSIAYEYEGVNYVDYYSYEDDVYYHDNGDGTHTPYDEDSEYYEDFVSSNVDVFDISTLKDLTFTHFDGKSNVTFTDSKHNQYVATDATAAGNAILGEWDNTSSDEQGTWTKVELYLQGDAVYQIVAYAEGTYSYLGDTYDFNDKYVLTFSKFGEIDFDLSDLDLVDDEGGDDDDTLNKTYTAVFTDANFSNTSGLTFTSSRTPDGSGFDASKKAIQFTQKAGSATVTTSGLENVTSVTVVMFTNSDTKKTYTVSVKVGNTTLYCDGNDTVTVNQNTDMNITFSSATGVDGDVSIALTPSGTSGSMYLKSVEIVCGNGGGVKPIPTETMTAQTYVASKLDKSTVQDAMNAWSVKNNYDPCIGILSNPWKSNSSYTETRCLVVPVEFTDASFASGQLDKVKLAFNGTEDETGWQSVNSYYKKSSYGKLNLQYDFVAEPYKSSHNMAYYEKTNFGTNRDGSTALLEEIMEYYNSTIDFSQYDINGDDFIDAIYIIYAGDIDYDDADLYWAFVTQYYPETEGSEDAYDNKYLGYYLFAGADFIYEYTGTSNDPYKDYYKEDLTISGLKINASTFIHETGHLLDLDDYYDYYDTQGSGEGLGGSDMMDNTVGDHNPYSKMILGWIEPTIVTTTQTITIDAFESSGDCIMLLLDYNDSYFCEYLLIDLYANTGLNEAHAKQADSLLYYDYDTGIGAEYGVRIYHVSADISDPYSDDYYSFTTNNNSVSTNALIKLVEADGETKFASTNGYACSSDLWQAGDKLCEVFPNYATNDNKKVNFDIEIVSVSKTQATITITFNA